MPMWLCTGMQQELAAGMCASVLIVIVQQQLNDIFPEMHSTSCRLLATSALSFAVYVLLYRLTITPTNPRLT